MDELRARLVERCDDVAVSYWGEPLIRTRSELRWGTRNGSLALALWPPHKRGLWRDRGGDAGGDMLDMAQQENSGSFARGVEDACRRVGYSPASLDQTLTAEQRARRERIAAADARRREIERARAAAKAKRADEQDRNRRVRVAQFIAGNADGIEAGSLGDRYLVETRGIPRPAAGWPDAVRFLDAWNDMPPAAVFIATDDAGQVCGVQKVEIDGQAKKIRKISRGAFAGTGAVVRLPGPATGPLVIGEGPETGLSPWAATEFETWISLGSLSKLPLPPGRTIVVCRDDDPHNSPADKALRLAIARWQRAGHTVCVATPWEVRRHDRSDFNDVIREGGVDAVRARIDAAMRAPQPRRRIPVHEARRRMRDIASRFTSIVRNHAGDDPPPVLAAKIGVAVGKSSTTREEVAVLLATMRAAADDRTLAFLVPTHRLGREAADAFNLLDVARAAGLTAAIWRGRSAEDPDAPGQTMCRDLERTYDAMAAGADIETSCCRKKMPDGTVVECPFFRECGYQKQKAQRADLWFGAHELMFQEKPAALGDLAGLIVDESFWQAGLEDKRDLSLSTLSLAPLPPGIDGQRLQFLRGLLAEVLSEHADGPARRAAFAEAESLLTADMAGEAARLEWRMKTDPGFHPGMTRQEYKDARLKAAGNRVVRRLASVWKAVEALLREDGPEASGRLSLTTEATDDGFVRMLEIKGRKDVRSGWQVPTFLIDATLEIDLVRGYFPQADLVADIEAQAPHQRIIQATGRSCAKSHFFADAADDRHLRKLAGTIGMMARKYAPDRVLVVAQLPVRGWLETYTIPPANVEFAHHNAVAGLDHWGPQPDDPGVAAMICVGRTLPSPDQIENMAEALTGTAVERLPGWYQKRQVAREMSNGQMATTEADFHPDTIAETIRRDVCEGQIVQIIGRPRGVNRTKENPVDVIVLTDVPLPLPVDHLVQASDLDPSPTDRMLAEEGAAFSNSSDVATVFETLWKTAGAAKTALNRAGRWVPFPYALQDEGNETDLPADFVRVEYKRTGSGRDKSRALFDLSRIPDPQAWLTKRLGPLVHYAVIEQAQDRPKRPPQPIGVVEEPAAQAAAETVIPAAIEPQPAGDDGFGTVEFWDNDPFFQPPVEREIGKMTDIRDLDRIRGSSENIETKQNTIGGYIPASHERSRCHRP
ncbi:MAG: toprim domain-containing protein [Rhodopila sp.]